MARRIITKEELDSQIENGIDPVRELPAGFPSVHSRFPAIPSQAFIDETRETTDQAAAATLEGDAARAAVRNKLAKLFPHVS